MSSRLSGRDAALSFPARSPRRTRGRQLLPTLAMTFAGGLMLATSVPAIAVTAIADGDVASVYAPVHDEIVAAPQQLDDLHRVRRRPFSQIVADAPECDAVGRGKVLANAADEDFIPIGAVLGHGVSLRVQIVHNDHAGEGRESAPGPSPP